MQPFSRQANAEFVAFKQFSEKQSSNCLNDKKVLRLRLIGL